MKLHLFHVVLAGNRLYERHECMIHVEVVPPDSDMSTQLIMYHVEMTCKQTIDPIQ
jgi:hypothetical protein